MSISRLPPRIFRPLTSAGLMIGAPRLATPPDCQIQDRMIDALLGEEGGELLPDRRGLPRRALGVGAHQARHQADVELGIFAAGVGDRVEAHIERAFSHRGKLRHRLHQRGVGIDLPGHRAVGALFQLGGERAAQRGRGSRPPRSVPPGNWWEILSVCAAAAIRPEAITAGAASAAAIMLRREISMAFLPSSVCALRAICMHRDSSMLVANRRRRVLDCGIPISGGRCD